jgi:hypothetical protein
LNSQYILTLNPSPKERDFEQPIHPHPNPSPKERDFEQPIHPHPNPSPKERGFEQPPHPCAFLSNHP